jgi:glycosyltransferase involved in cell wall biosynthesis
VATALLDLSVLRTATRARGIGRYVADLARALDPAARPASDFRVLGIEELGYLGACEVTEDLAGAVERLTAARRHDRPHAAWAYRVRFGLAAATRLLAPDLVHSAHPAATPLTELRCPRVATCHDLIPLRHPEHYLDWRDGWRRGREALDYRRYHTASHVIAVSETTANDLVTLLGVSPKKVSVVYNGVDLDRWSSEPGASDLAVREKFGLTESSYLLCVGAADWRKNHQLVLRALASARRCLPDSDPILVWAARMDLATQIELRRAARDAGVASAFRLLGYISDEELAALYRGAIAQLFPSRAEGFGYPVIEAMAAGCPVITSDCSSLAEIAGGAAVLVDPEDVDAIADAIVSLASSTSERQRLSALGTGRAKRYSLAKMAEGTLEVYARVLGRARVGEAA